MKTTKITNLRKAALATVATAALVAGTAACGGKNDSANQLSTDEVVAALLDAARSGDTGAIDTILANTDPSVIAEVAPEIAEIVENVEAPVADAPAAEAPAAEAPAAEAPAAEVAEATTEETPAAEAPAEEAPAEEAPAAEAPAEEAPAEEAPAGSDSSTAPGRFGSGSLAGSLPNYSLVPTPEILIYTFSPSGTKINARVLVNAKSTGTLAAIDTVKISYTVRTELGLTLPMSKTGSLVSTSGTGSVWSIDGMGIKNGDTVTITVTNKGGRSTSTVATVSVIVL
ncbi:MAG: hypothetical protein RIU67_1198 [Actinomycetota bacterium]